MKKAHALTQQQRNYRANMLNANPGTSGTNLINAKAHGNRGKQLNPNKQVGADAPCSGESSCGRCR